MQIRALIIDDESLARERIQSLLQVYPFIQVIATCETGKDALHFLYHNSADLLFLDIQMPEMTGLEMLRHLPNQKLPLIVFVTAYDQYAIEAFEYFAVDYLLKPYSNERFRQTVNRVLQRYQSNSIEHWDELLGKLIQYFQQPPDNLLNNKIKIELAGKIYFIDIESIEYICSTGNYIELKVKDKKHLLRQTLSEIGQQLNAPHFLKIHRSTLINLHFLKEIHRTPHSEYEVQMQDAHIFRVSRSYKPDFIEKLKL